MARRAVIVKLGSTTLVDPRGRPRDAGVRRSVAAQVAELRAAGTPVVLVSSGAIALGLGTLGRTARPGRLHELQAASAVGQAVLQRRWEAALRKHGVAAAQVLLTSGDVAPPRRVRERPRDVGDAAAVADGAGGERERLDRHGRDHLRRQRRPRRPGGGAAARAPAGALDRHRRPVRPRPDQARCPAARRRHRPRHAAHARAAPRRNRLGLGRHALQGGRRRDGPIGRGGRGDRRRSHAGSGRRGSGRTPGRHSLQGRAQPAFGLQAVGAVREAACAGGWRWTRAPCGRCRRRAPACWPSG